MTEGNARREAITVDQLDFLSWPPTKEAALQSLATPIRRWFAERFGEPTAAQRFAWPTLAAGKNLLLSAPTGCGKTLAAFLPFIGRLLTDGHSDVVRCMYVAPLKALCNDALKNLNAHMAEIWNYLPESARAPLVGLRTGDTSARVRRALKVRPPQVLLTTPESLAVLLSQPDAGESFARVDAVVVDEVHALAPNKRGVDLSLSLERLEFLSGRPLQRIGLSATCHPLSEAARFLVGVGRKCTVASVADASPIELGVEPLPDEGLSGGFMNALVERLEPELEANQSTLVFANTRAVAERLTWVLRRRFTEWADQIAVHHSSLAAARRHEVEKALKQGVLRVVVSSASLELGIDIGSVDGVVLVHPPGEVTRLVQRIGRSGHMPGGPRRGLVLTATPAELLEAAVTGAGARTGECERLCVPTHPLDMLCQHLTGMAANGSWSPDAAFALVRRAYPYLTLSREDFEACLTYLSGKDRNGSDWLPARLRWEGSAFTIRDEKTSRLLRRNFGSILSEEPRRVWLRGGENTPGKRTMVGEVEDPFAERLQPGDRFLLDRRCLEYCRNEGRDLLVDEVAGRPMTPLWGGAGWPLSAELARRLFLLRGRAADALRDGPTALEELLRWDYGLARPAVRMLLEYFHQQESVSEIPDATICLVEAVPREIGTEHFIHTPLNRLGNDALARVVAARLARDHALSCQTTVADLGFSMSLDGERALEADDWRFLLRADGFDADLDRLLADNELARERFRQVAQTGLMLLRNPIGGRRRVGGRTWGEQRLFDRVRAADPEFPLLRQALRELSENRCDADAARTYLGQLPRCEIHCRFLRHPSPFARHWTQREEEAFEEIDAPEAALMKLHAILTTRRAV
jgi:ATP-dependent Lhr-like helicase